MRPSRDAWDDLRVAAGGGTTTAVALRSAPEEGPGGSGAGLLVLPLEPRLDRNAAGNPGASLTLLLARQPDATASDLAPLILQGLLGLDVSLGLEGATLEALGESHPVEVRALFARSAHFTLRRGDGTVLAQADGAGTAPRAALACVLSAADALAAVRALDDLSDELTVSVDVTYQAAWDTRLAAVEGSWADVYDALAARARVDGTLAADDLAAAIAGLLARGGLRVAIDSPLPSAAVDTAAVVEAFRHVASPVVSPISGEPLFRLRQRPAEAASLELAVPLRTAVAETRTVAAPLASLCTRAFLPGDRERCLHLVAGDASAATGISSVPGRLATTRSLPAVAQRPRIAVAGAGFRALPLVLSPDRAQRPTAAALYASDLLPRPIEGRIPDPVPAGDIVVPPVTVPPLPLPIVPDPAAALFVDRIDSARVWFAPRYALEEPAAGSDPETGPFLFRIRNAGVVVGAGSTVEPGLAATVRFRLQPTMTQATRDALAARGNPQAVPVAPEGLSVSLSVPYRAPGDAATRSQLFAATVQLGDGGEIVATVDLLDDWVKLAYGALSTPGFQSQPAQIQVAYSFRGYQPFDLGTMDVGLGGLLAHILVVPTPADAPAGQVAIASSTRQVLLPGATISLTPSLARGPAASRRLPVDHVPVDDSDLHVPPRPAHPVVTSVPPPVVRPVFTVPPPILGPLRQTRFILQSFLQADASDLSLPCATLGGLYRQITADGEIALGCQDALRLGATVDHAYSEIAEFADPLYRVFRSLHQPGRFLVLPATYRVARYGPDDPDDRAFRPVLLVYGEIGATDADTRYVVSATLQADIPEWVRRDLLERLRAIAPAGFAPILEYPTDTTIGAQVAYSWLTLPGVGEPSVIRLDDAFQVTVSTDLLGGLLLVNAIQATGLSAAVTFTLGDGTALSSRLVLETRPAGPWRGGPITVALDGTTATLTNRIETPLDVSDLVVQVAGVAQRIDVSRSLAPGASFATSVPATAVDGYAVYSTNGATIPLGELDVFVEDITTSLSFVNLVALADHGLSSIEVHGREAGTTDDQIETIRADQPVVQLAFTLPITRYLERRLFEFRLVERRNDGSTAATDWQTWDEAASGAVITIQTSDL